MVFLKQIFNKNKFNQMAVVGLHLNFIFVDLINNNTNT